MKLFSIVKNKEFDGSVGVGFYIIFAPMSTRII